MSKVEILLATYNGDAFIKEQLDSILNQSFKDWRLIVRDDGSTDQTLNILHKYIQKYPNQIELYKNNQHNTGATKNFSKLLEFSEANYLMLCDQDDVWMPDKIGTTFNKMLEMENTFGNEMPLLVHTDLTVVDENRDVLAPSISKYKKINLYNSKKLNRLIVQNPVFGCTVMINRKLRDMVIPIPDEAMVHDWWVALVANAFGKICYLNEQTIYYRQHKKNVVGAKREGLQYYFKQLLNFNQSKSDLFNSIKQCSAFCNRYSNKLDRKTYEVLRHYSCLKKYNLIKRRLILLKYGFFKSNFLRTVGLFFMI